MVQKNGLESSALFHGEFNGAHYVLHPDGLNIAGDVSKDTIHAIKERIMRIYSDDTNEENQKFDDNLSYVDLLRILNK